MDDLAQGAAETPIPGKPLAFWKTQIARAVEVRKAHERWWDANLAAYAPRPTDDPAVYGSKVNTNRDFTLVERKKADLFYQKPDVSLQPSPRLEQNRPVPDPLTGQPQIDPRTQQPVMTNDLPALAAHEQILNEELGPDGIDAVGLFHRLIFNVLCPAGIGPSILGYESFTKDTEDVDPVTGAPITVPVPVLERVFWHDFSPKQILIPADARSTDYDRLPFLGWQFELPLTAASRAKFSLPDDFEGSTRNQDQQFDHGTGGSGGADHVVTGTELWYRSALFRDDVVHPDHLTHVVLVDGRPDYAIHEDCPYQTLDPTTGQLTPDSLLGFPIHILTTRVLTDSAYPPSDCTLIRPLVNELNVFRDQMVQYRDAQTLRFQYNTDVLPPDALSKIVRSPIGGMIGVPAEAFQTDAIKELPHGSMPRESFTSNDYIDNDIARTTAIDAAGAGTQSDKSTTATEVQTVQANANARLDFERGRVLQCYLLGVTKLSTLIQRYLPVTRAANIVGPELAQTWDQWRHRTEAALAFTAMPDSALRVDQAVDRKQAQELYSYLAQDPFVQQGRGKLLERLLRKFHIDPTGIVMPPAPPQPQPTPAALSFKGEDLIGPQAPIVIELLMQSGWKISPQAVQQSQGLLLQQQQLAEAAEAEQAAQTGDTRHGGKLPKAETLDKHQADAGKGMQGLGGIALGGTH